MRRSTPKINPKQLQRESLEALGTRLRGAREAKGLSLEKIAQQTLIQLRLLRAIEQGDLDTLPEPVYIRNLLKQFANALGLDGAEIASAFPVQIEAQSRRSPVWAALPLPLLQLRPIHLYVIYVIVVILSVRGLSNLLRNYPEQFSHTDLPSLTVTDDSLKAPLSSSTKPAASNSTQPASATEKPPSDRPVTITVKLQAECWLRVVADGKPVFEGLLPKGTQRTWEAEQEITIRAGNAGGVLVTYNNEKAEQLGEPNQVREVTYQASSQ
ncbi:MAG: helix-turn-helix domain-containing protein [Chloroflexaceae bacterium]|nr:helix-turn-helix domain-containing protein [Chloroflexaceae bacterium]